MTTKVWRIELLVILALVLSASLWAGPSEGEDWTLRLDRRGIKVWTKPVPGYDIESYRALANMNASIDEVYDFLTNVEGFPKWVRGIEEFELLEEREDSWKFYVHLTHPLGRDRDYVGEVSGIPPGNDGWASVEQIAVLTPYRQSDSVIRVTDYREVWQLVKLSDNLTRVELEAVFDPGGSLPAPVINWFMAEGPYGAYRSIIKSLEEDEVLGAESLVRR